MYVVREQMSKLMLSVVNQDQSDDRNQSQQSDLNSKWSQAWANTYKQVIIIYWFLVLL